MKKITSKKLSKRLAQYGALTIAMGAVAETDGQVVYTDIADFSGNGTSVYDLDLNGDSTIDFQIFASSDIQILIDGDSVGNSVAGTQPSYNYPFALDNGAVIDDNQTWQPGTGQILRYIGDAGTSCDFSSFWCDNAGDNDDVVDKYLGLRFKIGSETHYGWARLDIIGTNTVGNWTIKDYAYNATPNAPINAGEGTLGINEFDFASNVKVVTSNYGIELYNLPETSNYNLYTLTGKNLESGKINANSHIIEVNNVSSGIYILELEDTNTKAVFRKKLVL